MQMMLRIKIPTESGNRAIKDGLLGTLLEDTISRLKAEAAYFVADRSVKGRLTMRDLRSIRPFDWRVLLVSALIPIKKRRETSLQCAGATTI